MPQSLIQETPYPERPSLGTKNLGVDEYAKRLEFQLWQCNLDKADLRALGEE
ncbi:hypothetical protein [Marinobacterium lutimaris]